MSGHSLRINGTILEFSTGETILEVAKRNGVFIPTLCHLKGARPTGACRICVVEVEKARHLVASCTTPAVDGMVVRTDSERVIRSRKKTLELQLSSGKHDCDTLGLGHGSSSQCPVQGDCRLQQYAEKYSVTSNSFKISNSPYPTETANPFIIRDFERCIMCGRCVQACNVVQVNNAISQGYRGAASKIVTQGDSILAESDCVFCGECVQVCPTGALVEKNQQPNEKVGKVTKIHTTCCYCGVGCQQEMYVANGSVRKITGVETERPNEGRLCVKGRFGYNFINSPERLKTPLIRGEDGKLREATWDQALDLVAERLGQIKSETGPDSLAVLASARITNEDNYIAQKFTRAVLQTNNIDHCARLCHASTVAGLASAFGSGAMTNPIDDIKNADVILITGSNPTENHPVISTYIKQSVLTGKTKLIVVDPRKLGISRLADIQLVQRPGTDVAWINGLIHVIIKEKLYDKHYIDERTEQFESVKSEVEKYDPASVAAITGIPAAELERAARLYASAPAASIIYAMGITQHSTGTDNVKSLANLAMLCGNMGIPGGGVNPLRGQNNVQGACDMGALPAVFSGYQKVAEEAARNKMSQAWNAELSSNPGLTVVEILNHAEKKQIRGVYILGENPMVSDPDLNHTEKCLKSLDFLVVQDIFLTETAALADVVLPAACYAEKEGTFTNTERRVLRVRQAVPAPGSARGDWEIICDLSRRMGYDMSYPDASAVFDEITDTSPSYGGMSYQRLDNGGIQWPCPTPDHPGTPILHVGKFARGKGLFHKVAYLPADEEPDAEYPLTLTTGRMLYHYHTGTMTMRVPGLNNRAPYCYMEISSKDAETFGIVEGDSVRVASRRGRISVTAHVSDKIMEGCVFIPFHFAKAAANKLTNAALDPVCKIPELKVCAVKVAPQPRKKGTKYIWGQLDIHGNTKAIQDRFLEFLTKEGAVEKRTDIDSILESSRYRPGAVIPVLQSIQSIIGFLPRPVQDYIALNMNLPAANVYGIVTFYAFFTQVPRGKYVIKVCMGTACYVMGANEITSKFESLLQIKTGETTDDRLFSLETVRCLGACGLAPVVMVNDDTHGNVSPDRCQDIIEQYRLQTQTLT